jgi:hypothetical protein
VLLLLLLLLLLLRRRVAGRRRKTTASKTKRRVKGLQRGRGRKTRGATQEVEEREKGRSEIDYVRGRLVYWRLMARLLRRAASKANGG